MSQAQHHEAFKRFECWKGFVQEGFSVNFFGARTREEYICKMPGAAQRSGHRSVTTTLPVFDEEYFEWIDLLEAVVEARDRFTMIELGAGYGRWLVNAAAAIRYVNNLPCRLIGVEAEPTHFEWMKEHMRDNGVKESEYELIEAAASDTDGKVEFYVGNPSGWYGQSILEGADQSLGRRLIRGAMLIVGLKKGRELPAWLRQQEGGSAKRVKAISLNTLLSRLENVNLIDGCRFVRWQRMKYTVYLRASGLASSPPNRLKTQPVSRSLILLRTRFLP